MARKSRNKNAMTALPEDINALVQALGAAFRLGVPEAAKAIEDGHLQIEFGEGPDGERVLIGTYEGAMAVIDAHALSLARRVQSGQPPDDTRS